MRAGKSSRMTHYWGLLAGLTNRQGCIVADVIAGRNGRFRGLQSTAIVGCLAARPHDVALGTTGKVK